MGLLRRVIWTVVNYYLWQPYNVIYAYKVIKYITVKNK